MKFAKLLCVAATATTTTTTANATACTGTTSSSLECTCCDALAEHKQLRVLFPGSEAYEDRLGSYYSANAALPAWCMVMPTCTDEVSTIAKVISQHQCPFGMRSGGHSAFKGSNGVREGVTVDFTYMNTTTYDKVSNIASIQPGSDWDKALTTLNASDVVTVAGRASVVGVGGFTTGGGYSFHSAEKGFAADTVANWEIVLASGEVINANAHEHPDLWKAQKGGSGNFGFVTRVDQVALPGRTQMWGGFIYYDISKKHDVFEAYHDFTHAQAEDLASQNIVHIYFDSGKGPSMSAILTNVDAKVAPPAFDKYTAIPQTSNTTSKGAVADLIPQFTGTTPLGLYANWMAGMTSMADKTESLRFMLFVEKAMEETGKKMSEAVAPSDAEFNILIQFQPVTESIVKHSGQNGGNVMGLERLVVPAEGGGAPANMWLLAFTVDTEENQAKLQPLQLELRQRLNDYADAHGINSDWDYLNYSWGDQDPLATFGRDNIDFIRSTAGKYDPHGVFQKLRHSGFKIPSSS